MYKLLKLLQDTGWTCIKKFDSYRFQLMDIKPSRFTVSDEELARTNGKVLLKLMVDVCHKNKCAIIGKIHIVSMMLS